MTAQTHLQQTYGSDNARDVTTPSQPEMTDKKSGQHASNGKQSVFVITTGRMLARAALSLARSLVASRAPLFVSRDPGARTCGCPRTSCTDHVESMFRSNVQHTEGKASSSACPMICGIKMWHNRA